MRIKTWSLLVAVAMTATTVAAECKSADPRPEAVTYSWESPFGSGAYLGVDLRDVTRDRLSALKLKEEHGVEITMVDQDAPAGKAGLKEHDVILTMNGANVESVEQLRRMIHETPAGRTVNLGISRDGNPMAVKVQLGDRGKDWDYANSGKPFKFEMPPMPAIPPIPAMPAFSGMDMDVPNIVVVHSSNRDGLMVENLTSQLGEYFGVKNGQGVLVRSVEKGSAAEKAGFHAGDVVVRVADETITDTSDWRHAMRSHRNASVPVGIVRQGKNQTLNLAFPKQTGKTDALFELPDFSARVNLDQVQAQLDQLQPEIQRAVQLQTSEMQKQFAQIRIRAQREAKRAIEQTRRQQELHKKDTQELQKNLHDLRIDSDEF